jgi:exodeoxyribonuclease V alpha subunit
MQPPKTESDFYFVEAEAGEDIIGKILTMVTSRIPKRFNGHL